MYGLSFSLFLKQKWFASVYTASPYFPLVMESGFKVCGRIRIAYMQKRFEELWTCWLQGAWEASPQPLRGAVLANLSSISSWWCLPAVFALGKWRQEGQQLEVILCYIAISGLAWATLQIVSKITPNILVFNLNIHLELHLVACIIATPPHAFFFSF